MERGSHQPASVGPRRRYCPGLASILSCLHSVLSRLDIVFVFAFVLCFAFVFVFLFGLVFVYVVVFSSLSLSCVVSSLFFSWFLVSNSHCVDVTLTLTLSFLLLTLF